MPYGLAFGGVAGKLPFVLIWNGDTGTSRGKEEKDFIIFEKVMLEEGRIELARRQGSIVSE